MCLEPFSKDLYRMLKKLASFTQLLRRMLVENVAESELPKAVSFQDGVDTLYSKVVAFALQ